MAANGIPRKTRDPKELAVDKTRILDRVQPRAEEYTLLAHNCPQGTAPGIGARIAAGIIIDGIIEKDLSEGKNG